MTWHKSKWELRADIPDLVHLAAAKENSYDVIWHTDTCGYYKRRLASQRHLLVHNIPSVVMHEAWISARDGSRVGFCQTCIVQKVRA